MPEENKRPDQNLRTLHQALVADKFYQENIPQKYEEFVALYSQPENARNLHAALAADKFYEENIPKDFNEAMSLYGLGKPSAEPRGASGLAQKSVGSPMVTETPVPTQPTQSSAPQYLSPEELGGVQTMEAEVQPMPQTTQREVPTPQQTKPFEDELTQKILRADILKKKAEESKKASESYKGSKLGALYNSLVESYTGTVEDVAYTTLTIMTTLMPEMVAPEIRDNPKAISDALSNAVDDMGIKKTLDDQLKSKGTTEAYVERLKNEGGIVTQGVLGLAESAFPIATPMQSGFFVTSFADAHKDIKESMPDLSPEKMLAYATTQGAVAMALEKVGFSNLISNKSVIKNITGRVLQSLKGAGKVTPDVLESKVGQVVNGFASEFETGATQYVVEEGVRQIADALEGEGDSFKFEGMEEFIGNTLKAGVAEGIGGGLMKGVGVAASSILTPKSKEKAQAATTEIEQMAQDIDNPNVSPEAKDAIKKQIDQKAEEILDAYADEQELVAKLPQESIDKINEANTAIDRFNSIVNDPNVSDASKAMAEENIKALTKDIEIILESAPAPEAAPKVEETVEVTEEQPEGIELKNEGKGDTPTKENVTERLSINNPFYKKVEDALVKLGLIEKYNPKTGKGDVVVGYAQETSDGGISAGKMLFSKDGSISYFDGDIKVSFDKNGNVISENTKEAKQKAINLEIEGIKESIANLEKTRDSEAFKYKEVTETDVLGNKKKVKRLKTPQELKDSTDKINSAIDKAKKKLAALEEQPEPTPVAEEVAQPIRAVSQAGSVVGGEAKQKELENEVEEINKKRQALRGEDGVVPADKMGEWNELGKKLNEARAAATRGGNKSSILIKKKAESETSDPTILTKEEKAEAADLIEQVIQGSKTAEEAVKKVTKLGYVFNLNDANLFALYLSDRYNPNAPQVGNNKSSFQEWVNGVQPKAVEQSLQSTPQAGVVGANPALANVEATAKALEGVRNPKILDKIAKLLGGDKFVNKFRKKAKGDKDILRAQEIDDIVNKNPTSRISIKGDEIIFSDGETLFDKLINGGFTEKEAFGIIDQIQDAFPDSLKEFYPNSFKDENVEDINSIIEEELFKRYINKELNNQAYKKRLEDIKKRVGNLEDGDFVFTKKSINFIKEILNGIESGDVFVFTKNQLSDLGIEQKISNRIIDSFSLSEAYHDDKAAGKETDLTRAVEQLLGKPKEATPQAGVVGANPALANVEATAKALEELQKDTITKSIEGIPLPQLEINGYKRQPSEQYKTNDANSISEAYHKAKADGSNPELVQAVETLLTPNTNETQTPTQAEAESTEAAVPQAERGGASQEEAVNQVPADTVVALKETPEVSVGDESGYTPDDFASAVSNIKSQNLTRIEGIGMGANQAMGTFISTEPENRYASSPLAQGKKVVSVDVDIKNPFVSYDTNFIDLRTRLLNENQSEFDELDFETFEMPEGESWTIDDLNENGIEKLSQMVTDRLKSLGYDSVYFPMTNNQEGELIVFDRKNVKPKKDAVQKQTAGQVPVQPKAGVSEKVEEGTPRPKPEETAEAKEAKVKRNFAQRVSAYNNANKTYKRSEEGRAELDEIKKEAESLGYKAEVSASKSGLFKVSVKDSKGKAVTLSSAKRTATESNADWSNGSQFGVIGRDYNGNKIVRFFDAKTGVELNPRSKEYLSAKSEFIADNAKKFIGTTNPIDAEAIWIENSMNEGGFYDDVQKALLSSDNAFELVYNENIVKHFENEEGFGYLSQFEAELADWFGSVSEDEFNKYFDRNYVSGKRNPWVHKKGTSRSPLDDRIKALVDGEADGLLSVYMNADEGRVFEDISNLIQKYPGGRSTIGIQEDTRAKDLKDHFRELTTLPWNAENIALMNTLFDMISQGDIDSKFSWDSLTNEQKNTLINEQETAFRESEELYSEEFGVSEEVADSEAEVGEQSTEEIVEQIEFETPTTEEKSEIKEDGFEVPTKTEMEQKREEIKAKFEDAVKELKDSFGDLLSRNLGVSFDPKVEAAKQFRFHKALVNAARLAIQLGVTDVKVFAQSLGKPRVDKFMERAWQDAELAEAGRPTIINTEEDMLNATYQRVSEIFKKQYDDAEAARKPFLKKIKEGIMSGLFEPDYIARRMLKNVGAYQALIDKDLILGTSARAKSQYDSMRSEIFGGLNSAEKIQLNNIIQARVIISIDTRKDAAGEKRPKHPGDATMEDKKIWLGQLEADNPKLYQKLDDRATKYFNAQKELLKERLDEGRITIDQYDAMVNNEYSPRVFLKFLVEEQESGKSVSNGGVAQADIKSLSDGDVESLYHNAEWLLQTNVLSTNRAIFHNRANRALFDFAKQNPNNGIIQIQSPSGFSSQTGQPTYSDPKVGFKQIQFFENGVRRSMIVPTEFYVSWNSTEPYINPAFTNTMRALLGGSLKRMFATGINPAFALVNIPRDIAHVLFFTNTYSPFLPKAIGQIGVDIVRVFPDALRKSLKNKNSRYYQYADEGGLMDLLTTQGRPFEKTGLESNKLVDGLNTAVKIGGYLNETSELMVRLAIREREINKSVAKFLKDNGRSPSTTVPSGMNMSEMERIQRNATQSARSYMDFSKGGRWAKAVDVFIPYFNAGVQGSYVAARYVRDNPAEFSLKMLQFAGLVAAATLYNLRYDEYDDIPEEEKVRNIILMLPTSKKNEDGRIVRDYITIPLQQTVSPYKTMIEAMAEWYSTGIKPQKAGLKALETAVPIPNPMNVPLIDAMNLYATNYDRFLDKKVFKYGDMEAGDVEPYAEFYPFRTPEMFKDAALAAKEVGVELSPERFKEALGKLTADPDNNIYYVALAKAYDTVFDKIPEDQKKPFAEQFRNDMIQILNPFERKFYRTTNPRLKEKSVKEIDKQVKTKEKLENDQVNKFVRDYIKGEKSEFEVKSQFRDFIRTMEKPDTVNVERLKNKFENSIRFKEVDNVFFRMRTSNREETKAHLFYYEWISASPEKRDILVEQGKMLGLIPKSQKTVFWDEFNRLKKNLGE